MNADRRRLDADKRRKIQKTIWQSQIVFCIYTSEREHSIFRATEHDGASLEQIFSRKLCGSKN